MKLITLASEGNSGEPVHARSLDEAKELLDGMRDDELSGRVVHCAYGHSTRIVKNRAGQPGWAVEVRRDAQVYDPPTNVIAADSRDAALAAFVGTLDGDARIFADWLTWGELLDSAHRRGYADDEYFSIGSGARRSDDPVWGHGTIWVASYFVVGSSEGYYVHIDQVCPDRRRGGGSCNLSVPCALAKFWNLGRAMTVAADMQLLIWQHYGLGDSDLWRARGVEVSCLNDPDARVLPPLRWRVASDNTPS
jgi:hypothetical protein